MSSRISQWLCAIGLTLLVGCASELKTGPEQGGTTGVDEAMRARTFRFDINVETGDIQVTPPGQTAFGARPGGPSLSLLGAEVIGVTTSNFFRSPVGQYVKNKRTIKFDVTLHNRLSVTGLVTRGLSTL